MGAQGERGPVAAGGMSVPAISKPGARILNTGAAPSFDPASSDVRARDLQLNDPRGEDGVIKCWTVRGCTGLWGPTGNYMELDCPHNVPDRYSPCPGTCAFTHCQRPWHEDATSLDDLLDPDVDADDVLAGVAPGRGRAHGGGARADRRRADRRHGGGVAVTAPAMGAADFHAEREALGMWPMELAKAMSVKRKTVLDWDRGAKPVPMRVAEFLLHMRVAHDARAAEIVTTAMDDLRAGRFEDEVVVLPYYRSQSEYDEAVGDSWHHAAANACIRDAYQSLRAMRVPVRFEYPSVDWIKVGGRWDGEESEENQAV